MNTLWSRVDARFSAVLLGGLLAGTVLLSAPAAAQPPLPAGEYVFDVVQKPPFKALWRKMAASGPKLRWVTEASGPTSPTRLVRIDGQDYLAESFCQPHNCPNTFFFVINRQAAYGYHVDMNNDHVKTRFYGRPPQAVKQFLQQEYQQSFSRQ